MSVLVIYDDRLPIPEHLQSGLGITRYGDLLHRRRRLRTRVSEDLARLGLGPVAQVGDAAAATALATRIRQGNAGRRFLYVPSCVVFEADAATAHFIRKLGHGDDAWLLDGVGGGSQPQVLAGGASTMLPLLEQWEGVDWQRFEKEAAAYRYLPNHAGWRDLCSQERLLDFLSATFDARSFNAIESDDSTIVKRSRDKDKMRREHAVYGLLPAELKPWFLPSLGLVDEGETASYSLERLYVPDLAIQWIHGSFDCHSFAALLGRLRRYVQQRPVQPGDPAATRALGPGKVTERLARLRQDPRFAPVAAILGACGGHDLDLDRLAARHATLWDRLRPGPCREALSHGDLCFSNILYDRRSRLMKFIDPRGADRVQELYLDEYYDLAKLSHSVLGGYDFVNHDLVEVHLGRDLGLELRWPLQPDPALGAAFRAEIAALGYDMRVVRLVEAGLFLSMTPLHLDVPKKVLAFLFIGNGILDALDRGEP